MEFNHFNFNVFDLEKSLKFYQEALNLVPNGEVINAEDGSFKIVYIANEESDFQMELTWIRDKKEPYNLGDCEFHLAFRTDDYEASHDLHEQMGCICYENPDMGIYFIKDPDGYWLEIVPAR